MKNRSILIVAAIVCLFSLDTPAQDSLTNMVAYYPFNGNANDQSGNNRNGLNNGATLTTDRFDAPGSAYGFTNAFMVYSGLPINLNGTYTFSAWFNLAEFEDGMEIFEISDGDTCNWNPVLFQTGDGISINHCGGGQPNILFDSAAQVTNRWRHLVMTVSNETTRFYREGALITTRTNLPWPVTTNVTLTLAAARNGIGQFAKCAFDDVRVYNRALSGAEVKQLFALEAKFPLTLRKAVYLETATLTVGTNYQVQLSPDLITWTNYGNAFIATNPVWRSTNYWDVGDWNKFFYRLQIVP